MLSIGASCDPEVRWVDPTYTRASEVPLRLGAVVLGDGEGAAFVPYAGGIPIAVVEGLQGGLWAMPTVRIEALVGSVHLACALVDGEVEVGASEARVPTRPTRPSAIVASGPGWVEVARFPIPVVWTASTATLSCEVTAAGTTVSSAHEATLSLP